jgi:hypothetical protein
MEFGRVEHIDEPNLNLTPYFIYYVLVLIIK